MPAPAHATALIDPAPPVAETFTEPRYLMEIAREMLVSGTGGASYPTRDDRALAGYEGAVEVAVEPRPPRHVSLEAVSRRTSRCSPHRW